MATPRKIKIKVGVIGLGIIGSRAAANLRAAGHQVYVWSRTPRSAPNFLGSMIEVVDLSDVIQIFVSDDAALLEVVRTIGAALHSRHIVAAHPTISPGAARQAAAIVESQGARYLDAPFTGSKIAAQNGQLVYYVGGGESVLAEASPALEATSKKILHVGEVGQASVLKIATNMVTATTVQALAEALAVVRHSGISEHKLTEAMEFNASRSATTDMKLSAMIAESFEPHFSLKHMFKDVQLGMNIANDHRIALPATSATAGAIFGLMKRDLGEEDFSVLAQQYEKPPRPMPTASAAPSESSISSTGASTVQPAAAPANAAVVKFTEASAAAGAENARIKDQPEVVLQPLPAISETGEDEKPAVTPKTSAEPRKSTMRFILDFLKNEQAKP